MKSLKLVALLAAILLAHTVSTKSKAEDPIVDQASKVATSIVDSTTKRLEALGLKATRITEKGDKIGSGIRVAKVEKNAEGGRDGILLMMELLEEGTGKQLNVLRLTLDEMDGNPLKQALSIKLDEKLNEADSAAKSENFKARLAALMFDSGDKISELTNAKSNPICLATWVAAGSAASFLENLTNKKAQAANAGDGSLLLKTNPINQILKLLLGAFGTFAARELNDHVAKSDETFCKDTIKENTQLNEKLANADSAQRRI